MGESGQRLTISGGTIARNTLINALSFGVPLLAAFITVPMVRAGLGDDRFGVILLAWSVVGYFSIFDLGVSRGVTRFIAEALSLGDDEGLRTLFWNAVILLSGIGLLTMTVMGLSSAWLVRDLLHVSPNLADETVVAFQYLAVSLPLILLTSNMRGVLEAQQKFGVIALIAIPAGFANYVVPLLVLFFTTRLDLVVGFLVVARFVTLLGHIAAVYFTLPAARRPAGLSRATVIRLLTFGGWLTVSKVISPLMQYLDRFFVAAMLSLQLVTQYATPFDLVIRLHALAITSINVMFPAFSAFAAGERERLISSSGKAFKIGLAMLAYVVSGVILIAHPFLDWWLEPNLPPTSALIMQILLIGILLNYLAHIPASILQVVDRPDLPAKLNLVELPCYLALLVLLVQWLGILGAALAWMVRVGVDLLVMAVMAQKRVPFLAGESGRKTAATASAAAVLAFASFALAWLLPPVYGMPLALPLFIAYPFLVWTLLDTFERSLITSFFRSFLHAGRMR